MNKNNLQNKTYTLDKKHAEMVEKFKNNEEKIIPKLLNEIEKNEIMLNKLNNNNNNNNKLEKIKSLEIIINNLKNKIKNLNNEKKNYYLKNAKYIFEYFEDKQNINNLNNNNSNNNIINNFFNITENNSNNLDKQDNNEKIDNKNNSINKYFYNIDNNMINYNNFIYASDICSKCKKGEIIYVESEGINICNYCSSTSKYLIENDKPSYKDPPKEISFYAYKRINHLREILAQFQAKESTNIPDDVFENIKNQIKKERILLKDLTNKKTKELLKNLGYNKFYEHIPYIKDKLGIKPPVMSSELEEKLCNLFNEIQKPYAKYCPKDRVNFLNYYYTLYKLCELINEHSFLPYFPMLKDREKRIEQDQIWKKICEELGWKFIPTL
tara:strand:+ start:1480 stop:2628 length:1149 start_codon:yes stop_codon:yes gene_type:complete